MAQRDSLAISTVVVVLVAIALIGFFWLSDRGWVSHSAPAAVQFPGQGWSIGADIQCAAFQPRNAEVQLDCRGGATDAAQPKQLVVEFWGDVGASQRNFSCQLKSIDLVACHPR